MERWERKSRWVASRGGREEKLRSNTRSLNSFRTRCSVLVKSREKFSEFQLSNGEGFAWKPSVGFLFSLFLWDIKKRGEINPPTTTTIPTLPILKQPTGGTTAKRVLFSLRKNTRIGHQVVFAYIINQDDGLRHGDGGWGRAEAVEVRFLVGRACACAYRWEKKKVLICVSDFSLQLLLSESKWSKLDGRGKKSVGPFYEEVYFRVFLN